MKKIKLLLFLLVLLPFNIKAAGNISPNKTNMDIIIGNTSGFTITANNAVGRVDMAVSDSNIISIDTNSYWFDCDSLTVNVSAKKIGTAKVFITLYDAATMDMEDLTGASYTITVNVVPVPEVPQQPQKPQVVYSNNNRLGSIKVGGMDPTKLDDKNYLLIVNNNITSTLVEVTAEDSKAKVIGNGNKELNIGENNFEIIITAENGSQNRININIVRKDGRYLKELADALNEDSNNISIILLEDDIITKNDLELIKKSKKLVTFSYYNLNKKLLYSWTVDGKKLNNILDIKTKISFTTDLQKEIYKASNYADGKYISFTHEGTLPSGVSIKLNVSDTFENKDKVYVYYYDKGSKKLQNYKENIEVKDGFIEYEIDHASEYFASMSNVNTKNISYKSSPKMTVLSIVEGVIILGLGYAFYALYIGKKSKK